MKKKPEPMTLAERQMLFDIRLRSKRGGGITDEELKLCTRLFKRDPQGYVEVSAEVNRRVVEDFLF